MRASLRPPGASPCPAKRAPPPLTRSGRGAPHRGAPRSPGPSQTAPQPQGAPRKDPEGNSRLSAQQPKAGRGSRRAGPGPDNDLRGSLRPPTLTPAPDPQPATLEQLPAQPYAPDARHPRPQLPACTREHARQHTPRRPQAWPMAGAAPRGGAPASPLSPQPLLLLSRRPSGAGSTSIPGKAQPLFTKDEEAANGDALRTHQASAALHAPQGPLLTPSEAPCPPPNPLPAKAPFSERQRQIDRKSVV